MADGTGMPVIVVFGPTASGKTTLAGTVFAPDFGPLPEGTDCRFRGKAEIISADSMQVYRGMDIGTAKPDPSFLSVLPHHLIDVCTPDTQFCAGDFVRLADLACAACHARAHIPVVLGGTAFYIRNFLYGLPETPQSDPALRDRLLGRMKTEGAAVLMKELEVADPQSAARIHSNDEYRIVRALEVFHASGKPLSAFSPPASLRQGYRFCVIALDRPRDELYERINRRVDDMFASGLEAEFRSLVDSGYGAHDPGMQAIGYREFFAAAEAGEDTASVREAIKLDTRKYAKRQETFIRSIPSVTHLDADDVTGFYRTIAAFCDREGLFLPS